LVPRFEYLLDDLAAERGEALKARSGLVHLAAQRCALWSWVLLYTPRR
jgi:hypothetical protein